MDDFKYIFLKQNCISIEISQNIAPKGTSGPFY